VEEPELSEQMRRFLDRVSVVGECWEWTGYFCSGGRVAVYHPRGQKRVSAARWAYEELVGPVPERKQVRIQCGNPRCVNPEHRSIGRDHRPIQGPKLPPRNSAVLTPLQRAEAAAIRSTMNRERYGSLCMDCGERKCSIGASRCKQCSSSYRQSMWKDTTGAQREEYLKNRYGFYRAQQAFKAKQKKRGARR